MNDLETLYSPSKWSKRFSADEVCQKHVEVMTEEGKKARTEIPASLNISYRSEHREYLDIFGSDLPKDAPILIFIHGGYWQESCITHEIQSSIAKGFYDDGIKIIVIGYEICPNVTLPQMIDNIEKAIKKCLEYAKVCKSRSVSISGHSAGAHLAASFLIKSYSKLSKEDQHLIKCVFLLAGIYDLTPLVQTTINLPLKLTDKTASELSPMLKEMPKHLRAKFLIAVGEDDSPAFQNQAKQYHEKLLKMGIKSEQFLIEADHFDLIENLRNPDFKLTKKIKELIFSTEPI